MAKTNKRANVFIFFMEALLCIQVCMIGKTTAEAKTTDIERARNSVVRIAQAIFVDGEYIGYTSGTGICVGEEGKPVYDIVTNRHVVNYYVEDILNDFARVYPHNYKQQYQERVSINLVVLADNKAIEVDYQDVTLSNIADLAIIHLNNKVPSRVPAKLGEVKTMRVTDSVHALGYPSLADIPDAKTNIVFTVEQNIINECPSAIADITVTSGTVSKKDVLIGGIEHIQHTADISHGNSGGPLVNDKGEVIGVNSMYNADNNSKTMYSISVGEVKRLLEQNGIGYIEGREDISTVLLYCIIAAVAVCTVIIIWVYKKRHTKQWKCTECGEMNDDSKSRCDHCGKDRKASNQWKCPRCGWWNYEGESSCTLCKIGTKPPEPPRSLDPKPTKSEFEPVRGIPGKIEFQPVVPLGNIEGETAEQHNKEDPKEGSIIIEYFSAENNAHSSDRAEEEKNPGDSEFQPVEHLGNIENETAETTEDQEKGEA